MPAAGPPRSDRGVSDDSGQLRLPAGLPHAGYPAQITAIWALERTYLESWGGSRPGAQPYREFVNRWTTDGFRSCVGDLQGCVDRQL